MAAPPYAPPSTDALAIASGLPPAPPDQVHDLLSSDVRAILDQTIVLFDSLLYGSVADGT